MRSGRISCALARSGVITITPSQQPLVQAGWLRPGTHVSAMGADTKGKQELAAQLVAEAAVYVDEPTQAVSIGECQHAFAAGLFTLAPGRTLGAWIAAAVSAVAG